MIGNEDIERYLDTLAVPYETLEEGLWLVKDDDGQIVVRHDPPVIVFRTKLMEVPEAGREALYQRLLTFNATEMMNAAYGLEGDSVVVVASLQSENLDFNEFEAAMDSLSLAMTEHKRDLQEAAA